MEHNEMHQEEVKAEGMAKRCWHWGCMILPAISTLFWLASIVFVIIVWTSVIRQAPVGEYPAEWWIVNALMFGVLALFGGRRRMGSCHCRNCGSMGGKCVC